MIDQQTGAIAQRDRLQFSSDALVTLIREAAQMLHRRGLGRLARETLAGELEDLHLSDIPSDSLDRRAKALDHEITDGGIA